MLETKATLITIVNLRGMMIENNETLPYRRKKLRTSLEAWRLFLGLNLVFFIVVVKTKKFKWMTSIKWRSIL